MYNINIRFYFVLNITNFKLYTPILYLTYIEYLTKFKFLIIIFKHLIIHFLLSHIIVRTDVSLITQYPYSMLVRVYNIYHINHVLYLTLSLSYFLNLCIICLIFHLYTKYQSRYVKYILYCKSQTYEYNYKRICIYLIFEKLYLIWNT